MPDTVGVPHVTLHASASGSVVERKVTQGQNVNAGDTLFFTFADLNQVWIKAASTKRNSRKFVAVR